MCSRCFFQPQNKTNEEGNSVSTLNRNQFKKLLESIGVIVKGNKVNKKEIRQIFGARFQEPEWMLLMDYKLDTPQSYTDFIEIEEKNLKRVILPSTYSIAKYGEYMLTSGIKFALFGLVYQYSLQGNPRNVHYAYRLFLDSKNVFKNSGFGSLDEAKAECSKEAQSLIENRLFDLT